MPNVLTVGSRLTCPHQGTVATTSDAKLRVAGSAVLRLDGVVGRDVSACPTADSSSTKKCRLVLAASGAAVKLTVNGQGVALESLVATTDGAPPPGNVLTAAALQTRLRAI